MGDLSKGTSLKMSLLLFTLISTALAVPAPCPPMPPMECGEGMTNCPGPMDPMGCMMPESCVAEGEECPFYCPWNPPMECGEGNMPCPGPMDAMGCVEGMTKCPGPMDSMGCMMPETCVAEGDECP